MGDVTVVMPNLNHGHYLSISSNAIAQQSFSPKEIVFFDDGSTDSSLSIVEALKEKIPYLTVVVNEQQKGVLPNLQSGIERVQTEYIYFAAADDLVLPGFIEKAVELLDKNPNAACCSQGSVNMDEDGNFSPKGLDSNFGDLPEGALAKEDVLKHFKTHSIFMAGNATVYRTKILREMGGFPDIGPYCDGLLILLLGLTHGTCISPYQRTAFRKMESGYSASVRKDIPKSLELIEAAYQWIKERAPKNLGEDFIDIWRNHALFHIAAPLCVAGDQKGLTQLLPNWRLASYLLKCGPIGRKTCELLLLRQMLPAAFKQLIRMKLGK